MSAASQHLDALARDARYALRVLRKGPLFTATAVLTLAVGIGANAAIFSMVDALLLRALPYPGPDRLALLSATYRSGDAEWEQTSHTGATWEALRDHADAVEVAAYSDWVTGVNLFVDGRAANVDQQRVSATFFDVLGVRPALGRAFTVEEDVPQGPAVAVLSHGLWTRAFGAQPGILGRSVLLRGEPHTVVGVMPEGFRSTASADLWTPLRASTEGEGQGTNYGILARLGPGVSRDRGDAEVQAVAGAAWEASGRSGGRATARFSLTPLQSGLVQGQRSTLLVLWAAVGLVLLIVCANLASLMLARSAARSGEVAARMALGGSRGAVVRQVLVEGLVLSVAGGALGVGLGHLGLGVLSDLARQALGVWQPVALDGRVIAATALVALASALAFGLGPALHASRLDPRAAMAEGGARGVAGRSAHWPRRVLVVTEVALGVVLVVFAGLLVRTFLELRSLDDGFEPAGVVAGSVSLEDARYRDRASIEGLFGASLERMRALPGVEGAAVALGLPYERLLNLGFEAVRADGTRTEPTAVSVSYVTPGFFETLRIPLLRGRVLQEGDGTDGAPVAVVNQAFVEEYLAGGSPLASRVAVAGGEREVVGVVASVLQDPSGLGGADPLAKQPVVYVPAAQVEDEAFGLIHTWFQPSWVVRSALPAEQTVAAMGEALRGVDPRLPFAGFRELGQVEAEALAYQRFLMTLVAALAAIAALLAALGIHGVVAQSVVERRRELGIRLALGSTRAAALRVVTAPGVAMAAVGVVVGTVLALASSRVLAHFLWGVSATDPAVLVTGATALVLLAGAASLAPGLRVLELDPARTLRQE